MKEDFKIGWSKHLIKNGDNIYKVTSLDSIQRQAFQRLQGTMKSIGQYDPQLTVSESLKIIKQTLREEEYSKFKRSMPKLYVYHGKFLKKEEFNAFPGSDMFFIDLDTSTYTDDIISNKDLIFNKIRYVRYIQRSISNKLHLICSFGKVIKDVDEWEERTVSYTIFILDQLKSLGYDFFALQDEVIKNNEDINRENLADVIDTHNMKWTQRFFCTPYAFLKNEHKCPNEMSIHDEYFDNLRQKYPYYFINQEVKKKDRNKSKIEISQEIYNRYSSGVFEYEVVKNDIEYSDYEFQYEFRRKIYGALVKITDFNKEAADKLWEIVCSHYTKQDRHTQEYYLNDNLNNYFRYWSGVAREYCKSINAARWLAKYGILVHNKNEDVIRIQADKFLSDFSDQILSEWDKYKKMEVVSPTGSGKTVSIIEIANIVHGIVIVPYLATNSLYSKDLCLVQSGDEVIFEDDKSYVMVFDQAVKYLPTDKPIIVDEAHIGFLERDFRDRVIEVMNLLKKQEKVLLVSATPCDELKLIGGERVMNFMRYHHKVITTFIHYTNEDEKNFNIQRKIEDLLVGASRYNKIVVMDDRIVKKLYEIYCPIFKDDILYFRASTRDTDECQYLLQNEVLEKKLTLCTRAGFNGLNFNNKDEKILLISSLNISQMIIQQSGRFRNIDINLHIYVNDEAVETDEDSMDYYRAASEFAEEHGAEFIVQDSRYDSMAFYEAKKQIVKFINENSCYDVCKKELENTEYFVIMKDVSIMKRKGVKKDTTAVEISNMIKAGIDLNSLELNEIEITQYKRFKDAIEDFCKKYNISSPFDIELLDELNERDSKWLNRLINAYDNKLLIDSILDKIEEVVRVSSLSDVEFSLQKDLAQKWIEHISGIKALNVKTKDNKSKLKKIVEIREEQYGSSPLVIMDNLMIDLEEKKELAVDKKKRGGTKGGRKGKRVILIDNESGEKRIFDTQDECIEFLGISRDIFRKIKNGKILKNKKEFNKYKIEVDEKNDTEADFKDN